MKIETLDAGQAGERFYAHYLAYIDELSNYIRAYGNTYAKPQPWWVNDPDSVVHIALVDNEMAGFVINGWRSRVDADTESEILELYVAPGFRGQGVGQQLAALGFSHLVGDAGFQVYLDNPKAERFWNRALAEQKLPYTTYAALENNVPVIKYRFATPASVAL